MRRVVGIAWRVLRTSFSEPKVVVPMLLFPIAFTFIFGVLVFGGIRPRTAGSPPRLALAFATREETALARALRDELGRADALSVSDLSEEKLREAVKAGQVIAGVIVPEGFAASLLDGRHPEIVIVRQDQSNLYVTAAGEVERAARRLASAIVAADLVTGDRAAPEWQSAFRRTLERWHEPGRDIAVVAVTRPRSERMVTQGNLTSIGFCIMFVMLSVMLSTGVILEERVAGTWQRLLATPASRAEIILGYLVGFFVNGWAQMGILVLATHWLFGVSWGDPLGFFILTSVFIAAATAIGLALAGVVRTPQQQSVAANIGAVVTSMVAGIYWPYEMMPTFMQRIGLLMPQYWALRGYTDLLTRGRELAALGTPLLIMSAFCVVLLLFGMSRIRFE